MIKSSIALPLVITAGVALPIWPAKAQATLQEQRVVPTDICAGIPDADPLSCAQDALWDQNWPAFLEWAQKAVAAGDYLAADWLGEEYESPGSDNEVIKKDLVRAYMWYDIAAQLHARQIQQMPPTSSPIGVEDNQAEINYRNGVAESLTPAQIAEALRSEKEWFAAHGQ